MYAKIIPKNSSANDNTLLNTNRRLYTIDANNYAHWTGANWIVAVGGTTYSVTSVAWTMLDVLELFIVVKNGSKVRLQSRINGGSVTDVQSTGTVAGTYAPSGSVDLLCNGTDMQLTSWIQRLTFYPFGSRPSWANP